MQPVIITIEGREKEEVERSKATRYAPWEAVRIRKGISAASVCAMSAEPSSLSTF